ncbi:hypothetical protein BU15DRAFT_68794 [Melanogaster broomeanus]|nr:hypothetical protein BU15DRAFT_68794 [Melanogaster broomeanus]
MEPPSEAPVWLQRRLRVFDRIPPRYESSWYGPHNSLFSHFFPGEQQFLVKPQPRIRPPIDPDASFSSTMAERSFGGSDKDSDEDSDEDSDVGDISFSSDGGPVLPRARGAERTYHIPDFIIAKATEFASQDRTLFIVEVKVDASQSLRTASSQLVQYMEAYLANHAVDDLFGLLIRGTEVHILSLVERQVVLDENAIDINDQRIWDFLHDIARQNWPTYELQ